jgi:hypothetical protein
MSGVRGGRWAGAAGVALRRAGRSPGGRPGGALERAAQGGGGPAAAALGGLGRAGAGDGAAPGRLSAWREEFLAAGRGGLKSRPAAVEDRRLVEAQRKVGELAMELDIVRALNEEMDRRPRRPRR